MLKSTNRPQRPFDRHCAAQVTTRVTWAKYKKGKSDNMGNFSYEVFSKVVERGTLAQAAAELNVTPSAVSHSISQLETELGFPLLIRNRTGVTLTEDGAQVLPIILSLIHISEPTRP